MSGARAVVLVSGGLDSAVTLACARRDGRQCHALSFDYGQRHRHELPAAAAVAISLGAAAHTTIRVDLRAIGGSALTDAALDVPKDGDGVVTARDGHSRAPQGTDGAQSTGAGAGEHIPITYVPARNLVFLSLAAGLAETISASEVYLGVNAVDYSGYPDCREPFLRAFEQAARLGTRAGVQGQSPLRVVAPLVSLSKAEIISLGESLGVNFALTHSCYDPDTSGGACGACDSCRIRRKGFEDAHLPDPTRYSANTIARHTVPTPALTPRTPSAANAALREASPSAHARP